MSAEFLSSAWRGGIFGKIRFKKGLNGKYGFLIFHP